ncbi:MAG: esterase family protein [Burkholderiaceae bacterium]|nr:esterase family protein [Burkholderiaceae bacterium]
MLFSLLAQAAEQLPQPAWGKVERIANFPSKYVDQRNIDVWLPPDYSAAKHYRVLYMQDGQMLFDARFTWNQQSWELDQAMEKLASAGKIHDTIVVGIWSNGKYRSSEYAPQKALPYMPLATRTMFTEKNLAGKPRGDAYLHFIVEELKPEIDRRYSTLPGRDDTAIMGSSMGGLLALYAISEYPEVFGAAGSLSTHWTGIFDQNTAIPHAFLTYWQAHLPDPKSHRLYLDHGTESLDELYAPHQAEFDHLARNKGYTSANYLSREYQGAGHSENDWARRVDVALGFLLEK